VIRQLNFSILLVGSACRRSNRGENSAPLHAQNLEY